MTLLGKLVDRRGELRMAKRDQGRPLVYYGFEYTVHLPIQNVVCVAGGTNATMTQRRTPTSKPCCKTQLLMLNTSFRPYQPRTKKAGLRKELAHRRPSADHAELSLGCWRALMRLSMYQVSTI